MTSSPAHFKNSLTAISSFGQSATISLVILVTLVILSVIGFGGLINLSNLSIISPSFNLTAPISIMESPPAALKPVVSRSNTTYSSASKVALLLLFTIDTLSSTKVNSVP